MLVYFRLVNLEKTGLHEDCLRGCIFKSLCSQSKILHYLVKNLNEVVLLTPTAMLMVYRLTINLVVI